jgi:hypothetical protein
MWDIIAVYLGDTWSQMEFTDDAIAEPVNGYLRPLNRQLMPWNFQIGTNNDAQNTTQKFESVNKNPEKGMWKHILM